MGIRYATLCSGIGCAELAADMLGWESVFQSEVDPFACAVLADRFPLTPNLGDMTLLAARIRAGEVAENSLPNVLVAGTPCFPAGTTVATASGFKSIESIEPGELVLTHEGRFKPVLRTGSKIAATWLLRGQGHPVMETTAEHPFLSTKRLFRNVVKDGVKSQERYWASREWTAAKNMVGRHWAFTEHWPALHVPTVDMRGQEKVTVPVDASLLRLAGAYVGDGWTRIDERRGSTLLGLNADKLNIIKPYVHGLGLTATESRERTVTKLTIHGRALARWLRDNFGSGAENKRIPMWLLGAPLDLRQAFLQGYADTDGSSKNLPSWLVMTATTVSRQLAFTLRSLTMTLGYACSIQYSKMPPTTVIEGRTVSQMPLWQVRPGTSDRSSVSRDSFRWQLVRESKPSGVAKEVFNLEVADDNSYVADGIVVHNCQSFSIAGKGLSLGDPRGRLTMELVNVLDALDERRFAAGLPPCALVWENVPNVLSKEDNPFGCLVGALVGADHAVPPFGKRGRWPRAGMVGGPRRRLAWRILDAQWFGVAQRRRRVFLVAGAGEGFDPGAVLLEFEGVRRDSPPRREARQDVAGSTGASTGGCDENDAKDGRLIPVSLRGISDYGDGMPSPRGKSGDCGGGSEALVVGTFNNTGQGWWNDSDIAVGLRDMSAGSGSKEATVVAVAKAYGGNNQSGSIEVATARTAHGGPHGRLDFETETFLVTGGDVTHALNTANNGKMCGEDGTGRGVPVIAFQDRFRGDDGRGYDRPPPTSEDVVGALDTVKQWHIAFNARQDTISDEHVSDPIGSSSPQSSAVVLPSLRVRRLTVVECERLQGLPDNYTLIRDARTRKRLEADYRAYLERHMPGLPPDEYEALAKDGPRYKAIGNGMAVPCMAWILRRLDAHMRGEL